MGKVDLRVTGIEVPTVAGISREQEGLGLNTASVGESLLEACGENSVEGEELLRNTL